MSIVKIMTSFLVAIFSLSLFCAGHDDEIARIKNKLTNPNAFLQSEGSLVVLGNSSLDQASIIFLPEIHDDPKSLMTQLAIIAREQKTNRPFMILDESLGPLKKSMWDVYSQKTMEILTAQDQRRGKQEYLPHHFEAALQSLANKMRAKHGQLNFLNDKGLWTLAPFTDLATPFYGWDTSDKNSLTARNVQMVTSMKAALDKNQRILVMAGARHIPELEFMTSQKLLCKNSKSSSMSGFFDGLRKTYGEQPTLKNGVGSTAPIEDFLSTKKYAVVFNRALYRELDAIVAQFKNNLGRSACMKLK